MAVGELLLSAFFQVLFDRLSSRELFNFVRQLQRGFDSELKRWEKKLKMFQAVLRDAEEKQLTDEAVKLWLEELQDLAYDMEDILDEFATDAWERQLMADPNQPSTSKLQNIVPACFSCFNPSSIKFNMNMDSKIKSITRRLDELFEQRIKLGLQLISGETSSTAAQKRPPSSSVRTERAIYGRDEDKAKILQMVLRCEPSDANFCVIPIVGMAGVGKTTLAREVYNDKAIEDFRFDIKAWVCVSDDFDVLKVSKALLESITCRPCELKALNEVQVELRKKMEGKKFLLVLDDVWNENYSLWETLKAPFMTGAPNSKIIMTTRDSLVASTMGPIEHYNLKNLSDDDCWSVFVKHAFEGKDINAHQISDALHKKVVQKCQGLPLAASTLGGLLHSKRDNEWEDILNSNIWDLPQKSGILPVLKLSYHHLPSHLKRCFAYCALFPKDYEFREKELVLLWMAEGIVLQSKNNKQLEDWGRDCFDDLVSRSILQPSSNSSHTFTMHDLVHDLAQLVCGETIVRFEANKQVSRFQKARHVSYIRETYEDKRKFEVLHEVEHLRTFLPVLVKGSDTGTSYLNFVAFSSLLSEFKKLRVLSLRGYYIFEMPNSIRRLRHLRFLNLAGTMIKILPESTSSLLNLQILILRDCSRLLKLPSKMRYLINLRHLDIKGANLIREMPLGMKELKCLQTLSNYIVGKGSGSSLNDLENLMFLGGEICISGLENVNDAREARKAMLCHKHNLETLSLHWGSEFDSSRDEVVEENVIDMLQPHRNIKRLAISYYGGRRFPSWIGDPLFSKMEVLKLEHCEKCICLPPLGLLGSLKELALKGMTGLKSIGSEIYGSSCSMPFQSLETLHFENLLEWEYWETMKGNEQVAILPRLRELSIVACPKFSGKLPDCLPSLETLVISKCAELVVSLTSFPMLCKIEIDECKGLIFNCSFDFKLIKSVTISRSSLDMYGCRGMVYNSPSDSMSLLKDVTVSNILELGKLVNEEFSVVKTFAIGDSQQIKSRWQDEFEWPSTELFKFDKSLEGLHIISYPEEVSIKDNCVSLVSFPEINFLSKNLGFLRIENSSALKSLPEGLMDNSAQLERLYIEGCDSLTFIVRGKLPSTFKWLGIRECHKLQHVVDDEEGSYASSSSSSSSKVTLKHLEIWDCLELTTLSSRTSQLLEALEYLSISNCPKLESLPDCLHNLHNLQFIRIWNCPSLVSFAERGLPISILSVIIFMCEKLTALPDNMHKIDSLQRLHIFQCPSIKSAPVEGFPINLLDLAISDNKIYKALIHWGLHKLTSLKSLFISGYHDDAESFPDEEMEMVLPPSLTDLDISCFQNLKHLSSLGFQSSTSLKNLWIADCPQLTSFPKAGLPSSLLQLYIFNCPLLKKQCKRYKGKEWSKIAHIPRVEIDGKFIYEPEEEECM